MMLELIGEGRTASVFTYGDGKVIKLFNADIPRKWIEHEYNINKIANTFNCPTPKVYEIVDVDGREGIVFQRLSGSTITEMLIKYPFKIKQYALGAAKAHSKIHTVGTHALESQVDHTIHNINKTSYLSADIKSKIIKYLRNCPKDNKLCHGDLHPDNYLLVDGSYYVIDWTNAYSGNPAGDIARTILMLDTPYAKK